MCEPEVGVNYTQASTRKTSSDPAFFSMASRVYNRRKRTVVPIIRNGAVIANASILRGPIVKKPRAWAGRAVEH